MKNFDWVPYASTITKWTAIAMSVLGILSLIILYAGKVHVPINQVWAEPPVIHICDSAPEWVHTNLEVSLKTWEDLGYTYKDISYGPCGDLMLGTVMITEQNAHSIDQHQGHCLSSVKDDHVEWAAVFLPRTILPAQTQWNSESAGPSLPRDIHQKLLTHELGHCLAGLDHAYGKVGPTIAWKSGHVMSLHMSKLGNSTRGIPYADRE